MEPRGRLFFPHSRYQAVLVNQPFSLRGVIASAFAWMVVGYPATHVLEVGK